MGSQFTCFQFPWKQESTPFFNNLALLCIGSIYVTFKNRRLPTFMTISSPFLII
jgi:hypothetical protein